MDFLVSFKNNIVTLRKNYSLETIYSALLFYWARVNKISASKIELLPYAGQLFSCLKPNILKEMQFFFHIGSISSLKELEKCFELLISSGHKKDNGVVLTPDFIIDYLLQESLAKITKPKNPPIICDPACGYGGFLIRAALLLKKSRNIDYQTSFSENIFGFDVDSNTLFLTKVFLELFLVSKSCNPNIKLNLFNLDTLLSTPKEIFEEAQIKDGFDLIVTNPPYVKLQNLTIDYRAKLIKAFPSYTRGGFATAPLFLVACHRLLSKSGCLGFITQNNLFSSLSGEPIRAYLKDEQCLSRVIDFCHNKIFENASAYTCLIFLQREKRSFFEYDRIAKPVNEKRLNACSFSPFFHSDLQTKKWRLAKAFHFENLQQIENIGFKLGELHQIKVGFATLKDTVFFVEKEGSRILAKLPNGETIQIEKEVTKPAIKIAEFNEESELLFNKRHIIFPYYKSGKKYLPFSEKDFQKQFPNCYEYLLCYRDILAKRDKGKINLVPWFSWGRVQSMEALGPKLLTKTFSLRPNFVLDKTDSLFCNGYAVFPIKSNEQLLFSNPISINALKKILNSNLMEYYIKLTSFQIEGNFQCYQKNFIERFGICELSELETSFLEEAPQVEANEFLLKKYKISSKAINEILQESHPT